MKVETEHIDDFPVVSDLKDFDKKSGILLERMIFNYRMVVIILCAIVTIVLGYQATKLVLNASFERMIPQSHPYIKNYKDNKHELRGGSANSIRVVLENTKGSIFDPAYLEILKQINDEIFLTSGVDRAWMKSLWTPVVRWKEIIENGFAGGPVMPDNYTGSQESIDQLKQNINRAGIIGRLVANNFKSSMIYVPLLETESASDKRLDYHAFSRNIEDIRQKFEAGSNGNIKIYIIGFAKIVGDLMDGLLEVLTYFLFAVLLASTFIYLYTRCLRSTILLIACSVLGVIWQLGAISLLGFELDPYAILVPFLIFAIGVSHGMQKMNGIMQDIGRGTHKLVAARYTFRRLFVPGLTALLTDVIGFAVLMLIDIPVIRDLALTASIGVFCIIFTKLILLPCLLSYIGVSPAAAKRSLREGNGAGFGRLWTFLSLFTTRRWAVGALSVLIVFTVVAVIVGLNVKIGDLDPGAPELRPDSRYNKDNAFITSNYSLSSDEFVVIIKTPADGVMDYKTLVESDRLGWALRNTPGVQATSSLVDTIRLITCGSYEGSAKWISLPRNQKDLNYSGNLAVTLNQDALNVDGSVMPLTVYLSDHKSDTLNRVVKVSEDFADKHNTKDMQFLLAAGNSGIEAATNIVVKQTNQTITLYLYASMIILCYITFRSWQAVLVALIPLIFTSLLCEALMVVLGIGVKVATLPVVALGVGVGIDYALYLLSAQLAYQRAGLSLTESYMRALLFTGRVVALIGFALASGVITWAWSPIKFQADMGILLTFMFFWNMVGALTFIPALSHFMLKKVKVKGVVASD